MSKKLKNAGKNTSASLLNVDEKKSNKRQLKVKDDAQIQNISNHGIWVLVGDKEYFMPFSEFPWFLKATVEQIYNLQFFHNHHLHWPDLDVDVDVESLKNPQAYPLKYL
jgi:hypothetical protein